ncbi:MAG: hypothetical protein JWM10_5107, partial [Myxococcaceae bacterium]|nr:hypothetical protein [Myxococcaceae bacterium]
HAGAVRGEMRAFLAARALRPAA